MYLLNLVERTEAGFGYSVRRVPERKDLPTELGDNYKQLKTDNQEHAMNNKASKPSQPENAGTAEGMQNHISEAVNGAKDYNAKFMEFAQSNTEAAFAFAQKLWSVKSPSEFVELSVEHSRKQVETLTKQTKELAELAKKVTLMGKP